ncbi:MAG: hypothetical protein JST86_16550 [Bacteroidetes bacterium]|nr:hypothetical protein [Bacteroidota bacterium]
MYSFSEVQRFRIRWAWLGIIILNGFFLYIITMQLVMGKPVGSRPAPTWVLVAAETFLMLLFLFVSSIRLQTTFNLSGIQYRYFPFQIKPRVIEWEQLTDAYLRDYQSFKEFGGWGIRSGSAASGRLLNTNESGKAGLQLRFKNGKLLLIGTKNPAAVQKVLDVVIASGKINRII